MLFPSNSSFFLKISCIFRKSTGNFTRNQDALIWKSHLLFWISFECLYLNKFFSFMNYFIIIDFVVFWGNLFYFRIWRKNWGKFLLGYPLKFSKNLNHFFFKYLEQKFYFEKPTKVSMIELYASKFYTKYKKIGHIPAIRYPY